MHEIRLVLGDGNFMNINNVLYSLDGSNTGNTNLSNLIDTQLKPKRQMMLQSKSMLMPQSDIMKVKYDGIKSTIIHRNMTN